MTDTENILKRLMTACGVTKEVALAARLDVSRQAVGNALKKNAIPPAWITHTSATYGVSSDWILYGTGSMLRNEQVNTNPFIPDDKLAPSILDDIIMIPMVKARLSAGGGSFETNGGVEKEYAFRRTFIKRKGNPKDMVLMRVFGDSMTPEIMDNDMVLIDQSKTDIQQGRIFAVGFEDCIYLKRIDLLPRQIVLTSTNKAYAPVIIDLNDDTENQFRVIGKVLWCAREYL